MKVGSLQLGKQGRITHPNKMLKKQPVFLPTQKQVDISKMGLGKQEGGVKSRV